MSVSVKYMLNLKLFTSYSIPESVSLYIIYLPSTLNNTTVCVSFRSTPIEVFEVFCG